MADYHPNHNEVLMYSTLAAVLNNMEGNPFMQTTADTDIVSDGNAYTLYVEFPGVQKENVEVELKDGTLAIVAEKRDPAAGLKKAQADRFFGKFKKSFWVGRELDPNTVAATMDNGVLKIVISKKEGFGSKRIAVT